MQRNVVADGIRVDSDDDDDNSDVPGREGERPCIVDYEFIPRTPPTEASLAATCGQRSSAPMSPTATGAGCVDASPVAPAFSGRIPLVVEVRRWRILAITTAIVSVLLSFVARFHRGFPLFVTTDVDGGSTLVVQNLDTLNFIVSMFGMSIAKPFELVAATVLPVVVFVYATHETMFNDRTYWRLGVLLTQSFFIALLTSPFGAMYVVYPGPQNKHRSVTDADIRQLPFPPSSKNSSTPWGEQNVLDTILRTAIVPPRQPMPSSSSKCWHPRNKKGYLFVRHGFVVRNDWFELMPPKPPTPRYAKRARLSEWSRMADHYANHTIHNISTIAIMAVHLIRRLETELGMQIQGMEVVNPLDTFLSTAQLAQRNGDVPSLLRALSQLLTKALSTGIHGTSVPLRKVYVTMAKLAINDTISCGKIQDALTFDYLKVDISLDGERIRRRMRANSVDQLVEDNEETMKDNEASNSSVYEISANQECGRRGCWVTAPSNVGQSDKLWQIKPSIAAFAICNTANADELNTKIMSCERKGFDPTSMIVTAHTVRFRGDRLDFSKGYDSEAIEIPSRYLNLRRTLSFAVAHLSWNPLSLSDLASVSCMANSSCDGLLLPLATSKFAFVSRSHIPLDSLSSIGDRDFPLLSFITNLDAGTYLFHEDVLKVTGSNLQGGNNLSCSRDIDLIGQSIEENHWYMDDTLSESFMAGVFFVSQFAVVHEVVKTANDKYEIKLSTNPLYYEFMMRIPVQSVAISSIAGTLLVVSVFCITITSPVREAQVSDAMDVHRVARIHLVEQFFPKIFLKCSLMTTPQGQSLRPYRIIGMTLCHSSGGGDSIVRLPPSEASIDGACATSPKSFLD